MFGMNEAMTLLIVLLKLIEPYIKAWLAMDENPSLECMDPLIRKQISDTVAKLYVLIDKY